MMEDWTRAVNMHTVIGKVGTVPSYHPWNRSYLNEVSDYTGAAPPDEQISV